MDAVKKAVRSSRLGVLLAVGVLAGCEMKAPQIPSTNFTISIPVANDSTSIGTVVADSSRAEFLKFDDQELLNLDFQAEFDRRASVGNRLRVRPTSNTFATQLGTINLPGQNLPDIDVKMNDIIGQDLEAGATLPLIPASEFVVEEELPRLVGVRSLTISGGEIRIDMDNGLPLTLTNVSLTLKDRGDDTPPLDIPAGTIDVLDLGTIAAGASASGSFSLAGRQISSRLDIEVTGSTVEGQDVVIDADAALKIRSSMSDLALEKAFAVIPPQEFSASQVLAFPDDRIQIIGANISEGGLRFNVTNQIEIIMEIELRLDDLKKPDGTGQVFVIDQLKPGAVREIVFDLDGNRFEPEDPLELQLSYSVRTADSGEPVQIYSSGEVKVEAVTEDLVFSRIEGKLNRVSLPVDPVSRTFDFPAGLDNVALGEAAITVNLTSGIGFRSSIELDLQGTNSKGETGSLLISEVFQRGSPDNPVSLVLKPSSDELTAFLNLLPTQLTVTPTVQMGDGEGTEVIEPSHWVQIDDVRFETRGRFELKNATRIEPDPIFQSFKDDQYRDQIRSNLDSAAVITMIKNRLPIGVRVSLRIAPIAEDVYGSEDLFNGNEANGYLRIPSGEEEDGRPSTFKVGAREVKSDGKVKHTISHQRISLSDDEMLVLLREEGVYTGVLIELDPTPEMVGLYSEDYVTVVAGAEIFLELNEDLISKK